jgi:pimeloyl-ACP methyl ester carboxylesterase
MRRLLLPLLLCASALVAQSGPALAGDWAGSIRLPNGELKVLIALALQGAAWSGRISIPDQGARDLPLGDIQVAADALSFSLMGIPGDPRFKGRLVKEGLIEGEFSQGGQAFPFSLNRGAKPAAVAAPAPEPGDREIGFPGFNALPLKGSVKAGGAHPYFAVMVAGSGPTDRDWSNPLMNLPSHGGRDFAAWLQAQGIGSLRYDKRTIGAKDPRLDISLDAVSGDIRAAMRAARHLPEARGKKLLLIGHSEGALLSLLVAGEADAALLLALPGMSMGRLILAQVKAQLDGAQAPEAVSRENMAFLTAALDAVRLDKSLPQPGEGVAPGVARLVTMLTAPLTRGYIRDTLDLDPWGAAKRLSVPCAVVWGDRDIQTWKPEALSPDFKGTVIQIPEANHLFKRETRDRATLNGATAMTAYGDSTPLADLTPVATWLKALQ